VLLPILAFDTSAAHCAAALLLPDRVIQRLEPMEKGQAERLIPLLEELLAEGGIGWPDLKALAVGTGPGNFTGVRISVAAARGLALGLGIPAVGVTRLEALAHGLPRPLLVLEDAKRGQVYVQLFTPEGPGIAHLADRVVPACPATGSAAGEGALAPAMPWRKPLPGSGRTAPPRPNPGPPPSTCAEPTPRPRPTRRR
jgi:tRNA threonylcarbamoyladenosine biosynthesis protein TsaB